MSSLVVPAVDLMTKPKVLRPHVVVLGAGASIAACPDGDARGRRLPQMDNLVETLGLGSILKAYGVSGGEQNFEALCEQLSADSSHIRLLQSLRCKLFSYFSQLQLPLSPTVYDYLLLSLRPKDAVLTFNWDPLLFDAHSRNRCVGLPELIFMHGNVRVGYCSEHDRSGDVGDRCPECGGRLAPSPLLFPTSEKDYSTGFIARQWRRAEDLLRNAFTLTVFGYSAPTSDERAVALLEGAWNSSMPRELGHTEFVDIKAPELIHRTWRSFIFQDHYQTHPSLENTWIARYPRRSCEGLLIPSAEGGIAEEFRAPADVSLNELQAWAKDLGRYEDATRR